MFLRITQPQNILEQPVGHDCFNSDLSIKSTGLARKYALLIC